LSRFEPNSLRVYPKVWQAMVDYFGVRGDEIFNMLPDEEEE
jgi:hypothetical protein